MAQNSHILSNIFTNFTPCRYPPQNEENMCFEHMEEPYEELISDFGEGTAFFMSENASAFNGGVK